MPAAHERAGARGPTSVGVLLPLPLKSAYDYRVPEGLAVGPGAFVRVPLGAREAIGVVWGEARGGVAAERLKDVRAVLAAPAMPEATRRLVDWVADYTLAPAGAVLRMAMSVPEALSPPRPLAAWRLAAGPAEGVRLTPARRRVIEALAGGPPRTGAALARAAGVGPTVVRALAAAGVLTPAEAAPAEAFAPPDPGHPGPTLSPDQAAAAARLRERVAAGGEAERGFSVTLLDGVTGAGKTETYFEAIAAALRRGRQVLVLLPEIALTAQWLGRFAARFGAPPVEWHSDLSAAQRRHAWRAVAEGRARVVVGARSALFLPFPDLGLIVVDEEHEAAYKQEEGVIYHARDMAVVRARLGAIPIVLVSATPSLETVVNVRQGRYARLHLPERHALAELPAIHVIDLRRGAAGRGPSGWLSPALKAALDETFAAGEQALLFLNRRGYAPLTLCRACGHRLRCPNCTAWLVEHRHLGALMCHHCGYRRAPPDACPACGAEASFVACGPGVERLAEEVRALWPGVRYAVMTSDTVAGPRAAAEFVRRVQAREVDLLIGTQIVAKGYDFPLLTLVGVVDADLGLSGGDLRAAERTYQLLHQVAGRAGRAERPGRAFLQTYLPEHPVMRALASGARERFLDEEAAERRAAGLPPFGRLAALIVASADEAAAEGLAQGLGRSAPRGPGISVLGPAPAPLSLLRGRHRRRLLLKVGRNVPVQAVLRRWLDGLRLPPRTHLQVDVDPLSFL
ncbi:MAG: primosomal protein N' [Proteobacteria bacterium]|nr:primosomal protein N' [Pseudomonadota bacterium]